MPGHVMQSKFFTFSQNNSGGSFVDDENLAEYVIIEAFDANDANRRAEDLGIYFNGCFSGVDCSCCGDRWHSQWSDEKGDEVPMIDGKPVEDMEWAVDSLRNRAVVHFISLPKIEYKKGKK